MLTDKQVKETIEGAFSPLRCVVEMPDYQNRVRFKIFDKSGKSIMHVKGLFLRDVRDERQLQAVLSSTRERVIEKGFALEPLL